MIFVASMALLALPLYLIIGLLTIPVGLGLLMLSNSSPWILNLYPFMYAAKGASKTPLYYLDTVVSLPLTIVQWVSIAWLASVALRDVERRKAVLAALALFLVAGLVTSGILSVAGIRLVWAAGHT